MLGNIDVVLLPEPLDEFLGTVKGVGPVDSRFLGVSNGVEGILQRCSAALGDGK